MLLSKGSLFKKCAASYKKDECSGLHRPILFDVATDTPQILKKCASWVFITIDKTYYDESLSKILIAAYPSIHTTLYLDFVPIWSFQNLYLSSGFCEWLFGTKYCVWKSKNIFLTLKMERERTSQNLLFWCHLLMIGVNSLV